MLVSFRAAYNAVGNLAELTDPLGNPWTFAYDAQDRLIRETNPLGYAETYTYDAAGNRSGADAVTGPANRLLSDAAYEYAYDNAGNLVLRTELATGIVTEYSYDHRDRLIAVERRSAGGIVLGQVAYTYDAFDRRITRTADADGAGPAPAETTHHVHDGAHIWADFDAEGAVLARYLYGDGIDQLFARSRPGEGTA